MKKLMIVIGLCSVALFGADVKAMTGTAKASAQLSTKPMSPKFAKFKALIKKAKQIKRDEQGVNQIVLNVPYNIETFDENTFELPSESSLKILCYIHDEPKDILYYDISPVTYGEHTMSFKFKGIPLTELTQIKNYTCAVGIYFDEDGYSITDVLSSDIFDNMNIKFEGSL